MLCFPVGKYLQFIPPRGCLKPNRPIKSILTINTESDKVYKKENVGLSTMTKKTNETLRSLITICAGIMFGFLIGASFPTLPLTKLNITSSFLRDFSVIGNRSIANTTQNSDKNHIMKDLSKCWGRLSTDRGRPKGAERLPPGIVASESDFYLRRLWGKPNEDLTIKPKYLVTFTVGYNQRDNIDKAVKKFSDNFTILLFHYDGRTTEWDDFEWSKRAIHVSARKQTKWWYAKRFLHPDIVALYDYIFIWDEDLGIEHFDAEEYIKLVKKYGLEISQPGLDHTRGTTWQMTKRRVNLDVHKFVEIMAPVFSRDAWRCVWHMIQNDLVHGWGLDLALQRCVQPAHEKIGVVDAQWIVHQSVPSLGGQGQGENGRPPWQGVRERCRREWDMFKVRMSNADKSYYESMRIHT
ncbi:hypothetical protein OROMI_023135 [Orobanche minor]